MENVFVGSPEAKARQPILSANWNFLSLDGFCFICYHIYEGLNKQGLTQDELAGKSDLPYTTLTKIETNVITKPLIQTVMKIAKGLCVSIEDLIQ